MPFCTLPLTYELALLLQACNMIPISYAKVPEPSSGGAPVTRLVSAQSFGGHQQCGASIEWVQVGVRTQRICLASGQKWVGRWQKQEFYLQVLC